MPQKEIGKAAIFNHEEFTQLISNCESPHHRLIFQIAYYTASRIGEVVALPISSVYKDGSVLDVITFWSEITVNEENRQVVINEPLREILREFSTKFSYTGEDFYLFPGENGSHLQYQSVYRAMQRALARAGLEGRGYSCKSLKLSGKSNCISLAEVFRTQLSRLVVNCPGLSLSEIAINLNEINTNFNRLYITNDHQEFLQDLL